MTGAAAQYCSFVLGDETYGVDALRVQEIAPVRPTTPVPLADPAVVGLMNLRGQIVTVLDVPQRLGIPRSASGFGAIIVVQTADGAVGLAVDAIRDVIDADVDLWEPPPDTCNGAAQAFLLGACKLPDQLLLALDVDRIIALDAEQHAKNH